MSRTLCETCQGLFSQEPLIDGDVVRRWSNHHKTPNDFTTSAENGCFICLVLLRFIRDKNWELSFDEDDPIQCSVQMRSEIDVAISFRIPHNGDIDYPLFIRVAEGKSEACKDGGIRS